MVRCVARLGQNLYFEKTRRDHEALFLTSYFGISYCCRAGPPHYHPRTNSSMLQHSMAADTGIARCCIAHDAVEEYLANR